MSFVGTGLAWTVVATFFAALLATWIGFRLEEDREKDREYTRELERAEQLQLIYESMEGMIENAVEVCELVMKIAEEEQEAQFLPGYNREFVEAHRSLLLEVEHRIRPKTSILSFMASFEAFSARLESGQNLVSKYPIPSENELGLEGAALEQMNTDIRESARLAAHRGRDVLAEWETWQTYSPAKPSFSFAYELHRMLSRFVARLKPW